MLLQRLIEHADRLALAPAMYLRTPIRWLVDLDRRGRFLEWVPMEGSSWRHDRGQEWLAPHVLRTVKIKAKLLADRAEYALGIPRRADQTAPSKATARHAAFLRTVAHCAQVTREPTVQAVLTFLTQADPAHLSLPDGFEATHNVTFRVAGVLPIDLPSVRAYWATAATGDPAEREGALLGPDARECLGCGTRRPVLTRQPFKIKRIPGGQPAGLALSSAYHPAFESYGLKHSLTAPMCRECAERAAHAVNALIDGERTHLTVGPLTCLFWTRGVSTFSPVPFLAHPRVAQVRALLGGAGPGRAPARRPSNALYATALSAHGGRVVVREWIETTVREAKHHLARYFALQRLVGPDGRAAPPLKLATLVAGLSRDPAHAMAPQVPLSLLRLALQGGALPEELLYRAVTRNRLEQRVGRPRAAVIKMVLCSGACPEPEDTLGALQRQQTDPAYLCGRLLAVLEAIQRAAFPHAHTGVVDRFYGAASSAPAAVFGPLLSAAQHHLRKLGRERWPTNLLLRPGLQELQRQLPTYPRGLSVAQQGWFALGYYHQRVADRAAILARGEANQWAVAALESEAE